MEYKQIARFGTYISKDYSRDIFRLLMKYSGISASEAASRLNLHIKTVQDFLEAMSETGILSKEKITDKRRPFFRYSLSDTRINLSFDLAELEDNTEKEGGIEQYKLREKANSGARFNTARYDSYFNSVIIWQGSGRERKERKFNLTVAQGTVLYNLPFPGAEPLSVDELLNNSGISGEYRSEVIDILQILIQNNVIEKL